MKICCALIVILFGLAATAAPQTPCGTSGVQVQISPAQPQPGQVITVTLANNTANTYWLASSCVFGAVFQNHCAGVMVAQFICATVITPIPPGTSRSQTWNQLDDNGKPVKPGTYAFKIDLAGPGGSMGCCPTVTIAPPCAVPSDYGAGGPGTGGIVPYLATTGLPQVGNASFQLGVNLAVGGAPAVLLVSPAAASMPVPWGTLLVSPAPPLLQWFFTLGGVPGAPGGGALVLPAPIPSNPSLAGASVYLQAAIADPGSVGGISHTQGKNIVICP